MTGTLPCVGALESSEDADAGGGGRAAGPQRAGLRRAGAPRRARHAAEAALPRRDRDRLLRARLLLGGGAAVLGPRRRLHDGGRLHERDHAEPDLRGGLQRAGPATPRRSWSPSTRSRSPTPTCSRSSSRSTTRPRGCARATTSAPSTAPASTSSSDAQKATAEMALRRLRRGAARRRPRAGHDRGRARRPLLLRRGLPPAVPAQGAERLLRPRRHRRLLPHPGRRLLALARPARRIASRAGDPLLRLLHRRLPGDDRHRLRASASAATGCGAGSCRSSPARSPASPTRRSPSPCCSSRSSCSAR